MRTEPIVSVSITAAPIAETRLPIYGSDTHQVRIGSTSFMHFTPAVARQWIETLTPIANEGTE